MKTGDLIRTAIGNTFRNRLRTSLTALAIVIGAFALAVTLAVNTGLNSYIDDTIASVGSEDTLTVTKPSGQVDDGIRRYDPDSATSTDGGGAVAAATGSVELLTPDDLDILAEIEGVASVHTVRSVSVDFVQLADAAGEERWELAIMPGLPGVQLPLAAGAQPDLDADEYQLALPRDYAETLGVADADELIGQEVVLGVTDPSGTQETLAATVVGVSEPVLTTNTPTATLNTALTEAIFDIQARRTSAEQKDRWVMASVTVITSDDVSVVDTVDEVKERLAEAGYQGQTVSDLLGQFRAFFDAILLMLVGFAAITLLAGSLGIVNTLLMSVQERTREIGLLKALGLTSRRVFTLFSLEAITIGVLSAAIGLGIPVALAGPVNAALANGPLADLPGLQLLAFTPTVVVSVAVVIIGIAFLAGTLPAARAAGKDPITALRHE